MRITPRLKEIITGLTVPLLLLVGLGGGELALRFQQGRIFGVQKMVGKGATRFYYVDEQTGLRLPRPGSRQGRAIINSKGFRGPELSSERSGDRILLAFMGSSTTYDANAGKEANTWPAITTATLNSRFPGCRFEYLNAGAPGLNSDHIRTRFNAHVAPLSPNIVVVLTNDLNSDGRAQAKETGMLHKHQYTPSWLAEHSVLWAKIEKNLFVLRVQRQAHNRKGKLELDLARIASTYRERMTKLVELTNAVAEHTVLLQIAMRLRHDQDPREQTKAANSRLFSMPYSTVEDILAGVDQYNAVLDTLATLPNVTVLDPRPVMIADDEHFADTSHTTAKGSRLLGRFVGQSLAGNEDILRLIEHVSPGCLAAGSTESADHSAR
jgi:lysophospholipase L1-like esterase